MGTYTYINDALLRAGAFSHLTNAPQPRGPCTDPPSTALAYAPRLHNIES